MLVSVDYPAFSINAYISHHDPRGIPSQHVRYRCFDDWTSAAAYLRIEKQCDLCGIVSTSLKVSGRRRIREDCIKNSSNTICWDDKIHTYDSSSTGLGGVSTSVEKKEESNVAPVDLDSTQQGIQSSEELTSFHPIAVRHRPFRRSTAFIVGHRNHLVEEELAVCDFLVYVEQVSTIPYPKCGESSISELESVHTIFKERVTICHAVVRGTCGQQTGSLCPMSQSSKT